MQLKKMIPLLVILMMNPAKLLFAQTQHDNALWWAGWYCPSVTKG